MTKDELMTQGRNETPWEGSGVTFHEDPPVRLYDLEERTARSGEAIIDFTKKIPQGPLTNRLIDQLVGETPAPQIPSSFEIHH